MRLIIYLIILSAFNITALAQNQLVEILADSLFSSEVNDQSSDATGAPLEISVSSFGGQSFIIDSTGILTRIEVSAKKCCGFLIPAANLSLEIRTGSDPAMGSSLITETFSVVLTGYDIYSIVLTTPVAVTKGDELVMIVKKIGGGDALWERSSSDVYVGGHAYLNDNGWQAPLSNQDHMFSSYVEVIPKVSYFSVADDGLIKVNNRITNVTDPISAQDAATKAYVDSLDAATKAYVYLLETTIPTYTVGDFAQGGIVFWVDETGQHGLVCAKSDRSSGIRWYAGTYGVTRATGDGVYAGAANTVIAISSQVAIGDDGSSYAAQICNDLKITEGGTTYGDWYLPSKFELNLMYENEATIDATALANGGVVFAADYYWSSTESSSDFSVAHGQLFDGGNGITNGKSGILNVRAVRSF